MSDSLNIVTGFHVLDAEKHIFVLEGLSRLAIKFLFKQLSDQDESGEDLIC